MRSLLEKNAEARLTVGEALAHPWLAQDAGAPGPLLSSVVVERLRSFTRTSRLERLLLNVAANQLTNKEIDRLANIFRALDFDGDGCVILLYPTHSSHGQHSMPHACSDLAPPICCVQLPSATPYVPQRAMSLSVHLVRAGACRLRTSGMDWVRWDLRWTLKL